MNEERYVNQQAVTIHKRSRSQVLAIGVKDNHEAMRALSGSGYKMYTYLCENKNNTSLLLSPIIFETATGLSKNSYLSAKKELAEKGYLIPKENGDFDFYNSPEMNPVIQKARAEEKAREKEIRRQQSLERARKLLEEEERRQREIESGILQNPFFPPNWEDD